MIISQEVFADNLGKHQTLVDKARVDGGLFGDTKLYYSTDVLKSAPWGNDAEAVRPHDKNHPVECRVVFVFHGKQFDKIQSKNLYSGRMQRKNISYTVDPLTLKATKWRPLT